MTNLQIGNIRSSYKNPFDDYNANDLDPELIMQYWCTPFTKGALKDIDEKKFFTDGKPIILQGSRGTGKTTILKYFSFPVQCVRANRNKVTIYDQIIHDGGIGFYFRCEDSFLEEFKNVFSAVSEDNWRKCFEHYFELLFAKSIVTVIKAILKETKILNVPRINRKVKEVWNKGTGIGLDFTDYESVERVIDTELDYINDYRNNAPFTHAEFSPKKVFRLYDISTKLIGAFSTAVPSLSKVKCLLLIDEYENLPKELQQLFNTKVKFCRSDIPIRIGMRSENVVTTATVNDIEYLREGHDYSLVRLDLWQDVKEFQPHLRDIAKRRLELFEGIDISSDIIDVLGEKEDFNAECQSFVDKRNQHLRYLLKMNEELGRNNELQKKIISIISYPSNRIAEMLNALWVVRGIGGQDLLECAHIASEAMYAFFNKNEKHPFYKKYKNDYQNKYRYALTVLICKAYKKNKGYYSFNTICYLSEGNPRTFINIVKAIISDAMFYEKKSFTSTGKISTEIQCQTVRNYADREFNTIFAIMEDGRSIRNLIQCLGNIFADYHSDRLVRYPETNQFSFNLDALPLEIQEIVNTAVSWSLIKKKEETQRLSSNISSKGDLYRINRIFSPIFNISYRTRGGYNVILSTEDICSMVLGRYPKPKLDIKKDSIRVKGTFSSPEQMSLFSSLGEE